VANVTSVMNVWVCQVCVGGGGGGGVTHGGDECASVVDVSAMHECEYVCVRV
jgi:hypothetical protein